MAYTASAWYQNGDADRMPREKERWGIDKQYYCENVAIVRGRIAECRDYCQSRHDDIFNLKIMREWETESFVKVSKAEAMDLILGDSSTPGNSPNSTPGNSPCSTKLSEYIEDLNKTITKLKKISKLLERFKDIFSDMIISQLYIGLLCDGPVLIYIQHIH